MSAEGQKTPEGQRAQPEEFPRTSYVLGLISGILIVLNALMLAVASIAIFMVPHTFASRVGPYGGFMMYRPYIWPGGIFFGMALFGLISGVIVLLSTFMIRKYPTNYTWGTLMIIFSVLSFFGMGGFVVGAVLGIVGGALAITWRQ